MNIEKLAINLRKGDVIIKRFNSKKNTYNNDQSFLLIYFNKAHRLAKSILSLYKRKQFGAEVLLRSIVEDYIRMKYVFSSEMKDLEENKKHIVYLLNKEKLKILSSLKCLRDEKTIYSKRIGKFSYLGIIERIEEEINLQNINLSYKNIKKPDTIMEMAKQDRFTNFIYTYYYRFLCFLFHNNTDINYIYYKSENNFIFAPKDYNIDAIVEVLNKIYELYLKLLTDIGIQQN